MNDPTANGSKIKKVRHRTSDQNERLASECSKLDQDEERELADLGLESDILDWPEYE
jgi:hypothetical protein